MSTFKAGLWTRCAKKETTRAITVAEKNPSSLGVEFLRYLSRDKPVRARGRMVHLRPYRFAQENSTARRGNVRVTGTRSTRFTNFVQKSALSFRDRNWSDWILLDRPVLPVL